jgi:2-oxoglutarate dehydrogenase E1 component
MYCDELPSAPEEARQLVLCSGKVYYDLLAEREKREVRDVHFLRLEQLYPFPADALREQLERYRHCHLVWCQEEPRNMGAWGFVAEFIEETAREAGVEKPEPRYAGRMTAASPATGSAKVHAREQKQLVADALDVGRAAVGRMSARRALSAG